MKFNWGTGIVFTFIGFAAFMGYLVFMSFQENIDLVTEDYYGAELKYEQRMTEIDNASGLDKKVTIKKEANDYTITFPQEKIAGASIHFYRPDNKKFDKVYEIKSQEGKYTVSGKDLIPGRYRVKISWEQDNTKYYQEEVIFVK